MYEKQDNEEKNRYKRRGQAMITEIKNALRALSEDCNLSLKYEITREELAKIDRLISVWHTFARKNLPVFVFTASQHSLQHIVYIIKNQGPL
jgi:ATP-dependent RNA circularization protein (DNA/RNA ligase family)